MDDDEAALEAGDVFACPADWYLPRWALEQARALQVPGAAGWFAMPAADGAGALLLGCGGAGAVYVDQDQESGWWHVKAAYGGGALSLGLGPYLFEHEAAVVVRCLLLLADRAAISWPVDDLFEHGLPE